MISFLTNLYLWLGLIFVYDKIDNRKEEFFYYLSYKQINKINCFYKNWVGYLLSTNPNYYFLFWKLLESQSQNEKYDRHKCYYYVYWTDFDGEENFL